MSHQSQHQKLSTDLSEAKSASQRLYEEFHNGDKKLNKMIMAVRDTIMAADIGLDKHIEDTSKDDHKIQWYDKYQKWCYLIVPSLVIAVGKHIYDLIMS